MMTKNVALLIFTLIFVPSMAQAQKCSKFLSPQQERTYEDPDSLFSILLSGNKMPETIINKEPLSLKTQSQAQLKQNTKEAQSTTKPDDLQNSHELNLILESLGIQKGHFVKVSDKQIISYLTSSKQRHSKEGLNAHFIYWEGQGSQILKSVHIQGKVSDVTSKAPSSQEMNRLEAYSRTSFTLTNEQGLKQTLEIPNYLRESKFKTLSLPQKNSRGEYAGYHWGLLIGYD